MVTITYDRDAFPGIKEFFEVELWKNFPGKESKVYGRANKGAQEIRRQDICKIFHQIPSLAKVKSILGVE